MPPKFNQGSLCIVTATSELRTGVNVPDIAGPVRALVDHIQEVGKTEGKPMMSPFIMGNNLHRVKVASIPL